MSDFYRLLSVRRTSLLLFYPTKSFPTCQAISSCYLLKGAGEEFVGCVLTVFGGSPSPSEKKMLLKQCCKLPHYSISLTNLFHFVNPLFFIFTLYQPTRTHSRPAHHFTKISVPIRFLTFHSSI